MLSAREVQELNFLNQPSSQPSSQPTTRPTALSTSMALYYPFKNSTISGIAVANMASGSDYIVVAMVTGGMSFRLWIGSGMAFYFFTGSSSTNSFYTLTG
eukprot:gene39415-53292_t